MSVQVHQIILPTVIYIVQVNLLASYGQYLDSILIMIVSGKKWPINREKMNLEIKEISYNNSFCKTL